MIGLSPLSTGHPLRFQPKWVRPSTGSYPRFSLPMDSSPGFASAACDSIAILKARFHCGSLKSLTSPHTATRWLILQKARRHSAMKAAPTACRRTVSGTVSLPSRGAFHLSLTVLVRYRSDRYTQAYPTVRADSHGIPRVPRYSGDTIHGARAYGYGAITLSGPVSNPVRLTHAFITTANGVGRWTGVPTTPCAQPPTGITHARFSHHPLSLATTHGVSSPAGTEMFHFPAYPPHKCGASP